MRMRTVAVILNPMAMIRDRADLMVAVTEVELTRKMNCATVPKAVALRNARMSCC